jgi:hypothetical protein
MLRTVPAHQLSELINLIIETSRPVVNDFVAASS